MTNMDFIPLFTSSRNATLDNYDALNPDVDYLDAEGGFDFDDADLGDDIVGALPGATRDNAEGSPQHDKRKSPDENTQPEEGDAKRQEILDPEKGARKPGRKPLTNEPTTKRKAQNRAAQRAFRERKEKHVKDLEILVDELKKSREADQQEIRQWKAEVERLRNSTRASLGGRGNHSPPPQSTAQRSTRNPHSRNGSNFNFDFPEFGTQSGHQIDSDQAYIKPDKDRSTSPPTHTSQTTSSALQHLPVVGYSTNDNMHGFANTLPQMSANDVLGDLFTPSVLKAGSVNGNNYFSQPQLSTGGGESTAGLDRVFQFNSGSSASNSTSPGTSSSSQWNASGVNRADSSCGTSPEPVHDSPPQTNKSAQPVKASASPRESWPKTRPEQSLSSTDSTDFNVPSSSTFDPVWFGGYRDPNDTTPMDGDVTAAFFDEALSTTPFDLGSPSNLFGILQSPSPFPTQISSYAAAPSHNLMAEVEKNRDGTNEEDVSTTIKPEQKFITCEKLWNQIQSNPDFQDGKFDLDHLCSELRSKARCSESGVMVQENHVEAALRKLGGSNPGTGDAMAPDWLVFEQDSWDGVIKEAQGSS